MRRLAFLILSAIPVLDVSGVQTAAADTIKIDCASHIGPFKALHQHFAGGFALFADPVELKPYLNEIGASAFRVWMRDGFFKGRTAEDAAKAEFYDFAANDDLIRRIASLEIELFAVLDGPPADPPAPVFAEAARHFVLHYTQGWANGFYYPITYWEIGNEGDLKNLGEEYREAYVATAKALKSIQPLPGQQPFKVGGPAQAYLDANLAWAEKFLDYCEAHEAPLDFFSFHVYKDDPQEFAAQIDLARTLLDRYPGYSGTELILDEWNMGLDLYPAAALPPTPDPATGQVPLEQVVKFIVGVLSNPKLATYESAIHTARCLMIMERSPVTRGGHFLLSDNGDVKAGVVTCPDCYLPGFYPQRPDQIHDRSSGCRPQPKFHTLRAFQMLTKTPNLVSVQVQGEMLDGIAGVAAGDGRVNAIVVNWGAARTVEVQFSNLPWSGTFQTQVLQMAPSTATHVDPLLQKASGEVSGNVFGHAIELPANSLAVVSLVSRQGPDH